MAGYYRVNISIDSLVSKRTDNATILSVLVKTYPGSRNTNILKLVKVRLGISRSFNKLEVGAGDA